MKSTVNAGHDLLVANFLHGKVVSFIKDLHTVEYLPKTRAFKLIQEVSVCTSSLRTLTLVA